MSNNKFNILPGFVPTDSFSTLKKYDIKEVYVGFFDIYSEKKWPVSFNTINRRGEGASFFEFNNFKTFDKQAIKNNISVYVAFNVNYSKEQLDWILKSINKLSKLKSVKGLIVSDINLLLMLKKNKYKKEIIISTIANIFNSYAIDFYSTFGAKRFVLDRQLTSKEVLFIINKYPQYKFEIFFLMGDGCFFIDGYCSSMHVQEINKKYRYNTTITKTLCKKVLDEITSQKNNILNEISTYKCNICLLYYLSKFNNVTLKLPNRTITNSTSSNIIEKVNNINDLLSNKNITFEKFNIGCKKIFKQYKKYTCNSKVCLCRDLL